jgi:hypothetical protein
MNYRELLYKFSSLPVKAFAIPVGGGGDDVPRQSPGLSVLGFLLSAVCHVRRRSGTGSTLILKRGIGGFFFSERIRGLVLGTFKNISFLETHQKLCCV